MKKNLIWVTLVVAVVCVIGGVAVVSMGVLDPYSRFYHTWKVILWDEGGGDDPVTPCSSCADSILSQIDEIPPDVYFTFTKERTWIWTITASGFELNIYGTYSLTETTITLTVTGEQDGYEGSETFTHSFTNNDNTMFLTQASGGQIRLIRSMPL